MRSYVPFQLVVACFVAAIACSDDDEGQLPPQQLGQRNESCQTASDCMPGLVCVKEVCSVDRFNVTPTGNECAVVACREAKDCCAQPTVTCTTLKSACDAGDTLACQQYEASCGCRFDCVKNTCVQQCQTGTGGTTGNTCTATNARYCDGKNCVQCLCDSHCPTSQVCRGSKCLARCEANLDCPAMNKCEDGVCVKAPCESDRECIASLSNVLAVCRDGVCQVSHRLAFQRARGLPRRRVPGLLQQGHRVRFALRLQLPRLYRRRLHRSRLRNQRRVSSESQAPGHQQPIRNLP
jgi:hypothetical protein